MKEFRLHKLFVFFVLLYILIVLLTPPNPMTVHLYHLNETAYRVLLLATTGIPAFLTWFAAFYGFTWLQQYNELIKDTKEGAAFTKLTKGSRWLAYYLPFVSTATLLLSAIANHSHGFRGPAQVISNYLAVLISLTAMAAFSTGARQLADTVRARPTQLKIRFVSFSFIVVGVLYAYFVITKSLSGHAHYYLSLGWLLTTVVVPFFFAWFMGLLAVLDLDAYSSKVKGLLYQKALKGLSAGILVVILAAIVLQYVNTVNPQRGHLVLGAVLVIRYIVYICMAAGFGLIGSSAKKLQQIEKI
jgi:hypothetical protein